MKQFTVFTVGLLLVAGLWTATGQTTDDGDYTRCDPGSELIDPPEDCPEADAEHPQYFPFPYNCRQYFECTNNVAQCIHCAPGTVWDQDNLICNHEMVVNCTIVTTPIPTTTTTTTTTTTPTPTTTTPTTTTPTTTTPTTTTPTTTTTTTTTTTEAPTTEDDPIYWICPEGYDGLIRHPYDCSFFYSCDPGRRPCLFPCQDGLYFNPGWDRCDHPWNVTDCVDGSPPPTSTTPRTTGGVAVEEHQLNVESQHLNYRNVDRNNFAQTVKYVVKMLKSKIGFYEDPDPCDSIMSHLTM